RRLARIFVARALLVLSDGRSLYPGLRALRRAQSRAREAGAARTRLALVERPGASGWRQRQPRDGQAPARARAGLARISGGGIDAGRSRRHPQGRAHRPALGRSALRRPPGEKTRSPARATEAGTKARSA